MQSPKQWTYIHYLINKWFTKLERLAKTEMETRIKMRVVTEIVRGIETGKETKKNTGV